MSLWTTGRRKEAPGIGRLDSGVWGALSTKTLKVLQALSVVIKGFAAFAETAERRQLGRPET
jgi:hypothetical protein